MARRAVQVQRGFRPTSAMRTWLSLNLAPKVRGEKPRSFVVVVGRRGPGELPTARSFQDHAWTTVVAHCCRNLFRDVARSTPQARVAPPTKSPRFQGPCFLAIRHV